MSGNKYYFSLAAMRIVAALLVFLFHYGTIKFGYLGVDLFIVLSGFLIASVVPQNTSLSVATILLVKRVKRIYVPLTIFGIFYLFYGFYYLSPEELKNTAKILLFSILAITNYYLSVTNYFSINFEDYPLTHLWSLSLELQFYVIYILSSILLGGKFSRTIVWFLILLITLFYVCLVNKDSNYYLMESRIWCFALGVLIFHASVGDKYLQFFTFVFLLSLSGLVSILSDSGVLWSYNIVFSCIVSKLMLLCVALERKDLLMFNHVSQIIFKHMANVSYPFYILHLPILYIFGNAFNILGSIAITYLGAVILMKVAARFD